MGSFNDEIESNTESKSYLARGIYKWESVSEARFWDYVRVYTSDSKSESEAQAEKPLRCFGRTTIFQGFSVSLFLI